MVGERSSGADQQSSNFSLCYSYYMWSCIIMEENNIFHFEEHRVHFNQNLFGNITAARSINVHLVLQQILKTLNEWSHNMDNITFLLWTSSFKVDCGDSSWSVHRLLCWILLCATHFYHSFRYIKGMGISSLQRVPKNGNCF